MSGIGRPRAKGVRHASSAKMKEARDLISSAAPSGMIALFLLDEWKGAKHNGLIFLAENERRAEQLGALLHALSPDCGVVVLPRRDTLPFDEMEASREISGRRASVLRRIASNPSAALLVTTAEAVAQRVVHRERWKDAVLHLRIGDPFAENDVRAFLNQAGYTLDERVDMPGSALLQGQVVELYPAGSLGPARIEIDEGFIAGIRCYDLVDGAVITDLKELVVDPVWEQPKADGEPDTPQDEPDLVNSIFDYLPAARLVLDAGVDERGAMWLQQLDEEGTAAHLAGRREFLTTDEWKTILGAAKILPVSSTIKAVPRFFEAASPAKSLRRFLADASSERVLFTAANDKDLRLMDRRAGDLSHRCNQFCDIVKTASGRRMSLIADFDRGFVHPSRSGDVVIITASDILGSRASHLIPMATPSSQARSSTEVATGDVVVHFDRGVAILRGLETVAVEGTPESEMIRLEFADGKTLLAPLEELTSIWRYSSDPTNVTLDKVDGSSWQKRRSEIEQDIVETADHLAKSIRERAKLSAAKIVPSTALYERFAGRFPYFPTPDQASAVEEVLRDMASGRPMDRIVCGDVGFGKTEVALRAAAAAVFAGKQVALAAPTTVLARQHVETFRKRFAPFGIEVGHLSRFSSRQEITKVKKSLSDGSLKLVVGTHALAAKGVAFADLGLVIVDEEQRFGAADKSRLSSLADGAHLLTMSATPIPRTLSEVHAGLRSVSLIVTPPTRRIHVRTNVDLFREEIVSAALRREKARKGQSFVVCPRIQDIAPMRLRLKAIVPELRLAALHGRMPGGDIDEAMISFAEGRADVLLATNIIESGLDLPRANTIVVWRPEKFGLAQLHQLRGRVGRAATRAFAYLMTDPDAPPKGASLKRLETLQELSGSGAGFEISDRDLDLRGGGDLLSEQQSGHVKVLGSALYRHLLTRAMAKDNNEGNAERAPELRLEISGRLPRTFIQDNDTRLGIYARLFKCTTEAELEALEDELEQRFGDLPREAVSLLSMARIRADCRRLGLLRIDAGPEAVAATLQDWPNFRTSKSSGLRLDGRRVIFDRPSGLEERLIAIEELIDILDEVT